MQKKSPWQSPENSVYKNTKLKRYRDGGFTLCRCNRAIFKSPNWELADTINTEQIEFFIDFRRSEMEHIAWSQEHLVFTDDSGCPVEIWEFPSKEKLRGKRVENGEVRNDSVKRAKDSIFDIVYQNDWKYFVTITFNGEDFDRTDPKAVIKKLSDWLHNKVRRNKLKYVLVPEYHKNGGIHCHALFNDCDLCFKDSGTRIIKGFNKPVKLSTIEEKGLCEKYGVLKSELKTVYNISDWKYGYSTAIETYGDCSKLAYYTTKYITKDVKKIFGKFYWHSQNIVTKPQIEYFDIPEPLDTPVVAVPGTNRSYQYLSTFTFDNLDEDDLSRITPDMIRECEEADKKFNEMCKELGL